MLRSRGLRRAADSPDMAEASRFPSRIRPCATSDTGAAVRTGAARLRDVAALPPIRNDHMPIIATGVADDRKAMALSISHDVMVATASRRRAASGRSG